MSEMKLEQVSKPIYLLDKITVHKPENLKYVEKLIQLNCKAYHRQALEEVLESIRIAKNHIDVGIRLHNSLIINSKRVEKSLLLAIKKLETIQSKLQDDE